MKQNANFYQIFSACLGNFFEHYDTALFSFLSPFLAPLIFPSQDPLIALILTYAMIPLGMLARPMGACLFGYIGDVYGRSEALFFALAGMSFVSAFIAMTPTYHQVGILSPLCFCLGRLLQNLCASGETMGGAILILENSPPKQHDFLSSLYNASTIGGILFASGAVALIVHLDFLDWGWRVLYLIGCVTGICGCIIRKNFSSENIQKKIFPTSVREFIQVFWNYKRAFFTILLSSGFSYANYSIALVLMNGLLPLVSEVSLEQMISLNTYLLIFDFCTLPLFGWISTKITREKLMLFASFSVCVTAVPLFTLLSGATIAIVTFVRVCLVLLGVAFAAPYHAWAQQLVPPQHRYAIISLGYAFGSQLLGGPTVALTLTVFKLTGDLSSAAWYWMGLGAVNFFILIKIFNERTQAQKA